MNDPPLEPAEAGRYQIERKLGEGGAGAVYLVRDRETGERLALKRLHRVDERSGARLKREFRTLADINHRNVIKLYDLGREHDAWFLTMEYLEGEELLEYLAVDARATVTREMRRPTADDSEHTARVAAAFYQLASGVRALHRAGVLHRDLKPSNVMVAGERVVVLDFGLAREVGEQAATITMDGNVAGTPAYMAPEQVLGRDWGEANDWYAFGVMLYESLSGCLPIEGRVHELLRRKLEVDPTPIEKLVDGIPTQLSELCRRLLDRDPDQRPSGDEVLAALKSYGNAVPVREERDELARRSRPSDHPIFGRDAERERLQQGLLAIMNGESAVVSVSGPSGIGKSRLVERFLEDLERHHLVSAQNTPLILRSRCYERENVPFKALDAAMDAIVAYLSREHDVAVSHALPTNVRALAQIFPALGRLNAVQRLLEQEPPRGTTRQARDEAEAALRDLLTRLATRRSLVLWIDDLHWGDLDSAQMLKKWIEPPGVPGLMLVLSYRSDELSTSPCLRLLFGEDRASSPSEVVAVGPLADEHIRQLARELLADADQPEPPRSAGDRQSPGAVAPATVPEPPRSAGDRQSPGAVAPATVPEPPRSAGDRQSPGAVAPATVPDGQRKLIVERIVREAQGSPFLASQLAELALSQLGASPESLGRLNLERLMARRMAMLTDPARRLLHVLAAAGRPVPVRLALSVANAAHASRAALHELSSFGLARTRVAEGVRLVEVYHNRLREAVLGSLSPEARTELDRSLLHALEAEGTSDVAWMYTLALGAGEPAAALRYGIASAEAASASLAFERAAELYGACLVLQPEDAAERPELLQRFAHAEAQAGHGLKAAEAYLEAARRSEGLAAIRLERQAASHFLRSGHFDRGEALVRKVLAALELETPDSPSGLIAAIAWERTKLAVRGLRFTERDPTKVDDERLYTGVLCGTLSIETQIYDPLRAALFQARSMRMALDGGLPDLVARALCVAATMAASSGRKSGTAKAFEYLERAESLARSLQSTLVRGNICSARTVCSFLALRMEDVIQHSAEAERLYREMSTSDEGEYYHRFIVLSARLAALNHLGYCQQAQTELNAALAEARATENIVAQMTLSSLRARFEIAADKPHAAVPRLEMEGALLPSGSYGLLHAWHLTTVMRVGCATGDHAWAFRQMGDGWDRFQASWLKHGATFKVLVPSLHARLILNDCVARGLSLDETEVRVADDLRAVSRSSWKTGRAMRQRIKGRLAYLAGDRDVAREAWRESSQLLEMDGMREEAARDRFAYALLLGGEEGERLQAECLEVLRRFGYVNPRSDIASYFPELA
jgi:eukaryotic-like serine/threonine-protein kinase